MPLSDLGDVKQLCKRFQNAQKSYELWRSQHQDTYDFVAPQRETYRFHSPGQSKNNHVFDSTATEALEIFASRIKGSNFPSWKQWVNLTAGSVVPPEQRVNVNKALEQGTELFFSALNHSNFDTELNPGLTDLGIGTGAIIIDEGEFNSGDDFIFTNVPLAELYPEKPAQGRIRSAWRKRSVELGKILQLWPDATLPQSMAARIEKDPYSECVILLGQLFNPKDGKYYMVVIDEKSKTLLYDQSFNSQRFIVFRWHVVPGETYGRGPAMQCLPDIRTLNKMVEFKLSGLALAVGGVYTAVSDGVFNPNTVRIAPKTIIPVSSNNSQNPTLAPLPMSGDPTSIELTIRELQDKINTAFFANPFGDISDPVRSATENMLRQQEMLKKAGASFGRIRTELIEPLIEAGLDILRGNGKFPDVRLDGQQVTIKHTSPMALAEDLEEFQAIQTWAGTNAELLGPQVFMGAAKVEDFPKVTAELLGVPAGLVRTDAERQAIGEAAAKAAQEQLSAGANQGGQPTGQPVG